MVQMSDVRPGDVLIAHECVCSINKGDLKIVYVDHTGSLAVLCARPPHPLFQYPNGEVKHFELFIRSQPKSE